ncbi:hypothetical protein BB427_02030 [Pseudoalteromonas sp. BMB]|uniref:glycosyltransferase n=1 Tax=Pseudoalteromonas sp. BMB TaxID=1874619 RepID=UPI00083D4E2E|nr:glycosyltransferase [Pseudoalteromonas sp. BMB]ODB36816.1 hypothetical protein BB427_02030 [Pseudoalteromonas sp. BMB]
MKVVHIIGKLNPGGVETWLKDLSKFQGDKMHIIVHKSGKGFYDDIVRENGAHLRLIKLNGNRLGFYYELYKYLKFNGIGIMHSHVNLASTLMLLVAWLAGVKGRIAHCHNDKRSEYKKLNLTKRLYYKFMKIGLLIFANRRIAVSESCSNSMFYEFSDVEIIPCGLSFTDPLATTNRGDLGLKESDRVIVHVGRFVKQKNHLYIIRLLKVLDDRNTKLLLIGEGPLKDDVIREVNKLGLQDQVLFLGVRKDVHSILKNIANIFVLPSKFEGLGLVAIEAQYFNVPTIVSDNVPKDVAISNYVTFLSLDNINSWVNEIVTYSCVGNDKLLYESYKQFTIEYNNIKLEKIYQEFDS